MYSSFTCDNFVCSTVLCFVKLRSVTSVTPNFIQGVSTLGHDSFLTDKGNVPCVQQPILDYFLSYLNIFISLLIFLRTECEEKFGNESKK